MWTGALFWGKCHGPDLKSAVLFPRNLFLSSHQTSTLTLFAQSTLVYWLPYSSHTSHHPSQTPCLPWISYATQKLMLDSCKMVKKQSEAFHTFLWHFFQVMNRILLHIVLLKCPHTQIAFLKFTSCDNQGFSRVYSNCCCSCSFEPEIVNIGHQKWYLIHPSLTFSSIRLVSRVKLSNPVKGVAPSPKPRCSSYWKGSLLVTLDYGHQI